MSLPVAVISLLGFASHPEHTTAVWLNTADGCPYPTHPRHVRDFEEGEDKWQCPNQQLSLDDRRAVLPPPYDKINEEVPHGWLNGKYVPFPATGADATPVSTNTPGYYYDEVDYVAYNVARPTGERAPIHYHEVAQLLCLTEGNITVLTEGLQPKNYSAPACYMMPAYTKVTVLSLVTKVELCPLRIPKGGLDWVVLEPEYYELQGGFAHH
jgi:hypothetical protein